MLQGGGSGYTSGTASNYAASKSTYPSSTSLNSIGSSVSRSVNAVNENEKNEIR